MASCCARSTLGDFRICKPLGGEGSTCNRFSQHHLWEGQRDGYYCPCQGGLSCQGPRRGMCLMWPGLTSEDLTEYAMWNKEWYL